MTALLISQLIFHSLTVAYYVDIFLNPNASIGTKT